MAYVKCTTKAPNLVVGKAYKVLSGGNTAIVIKNTTGREAYSFSYFTNISNDDMGQVCTRCNHYVNSDHDVCPDCKKDDCLHPRILDDECQNCKRSWNAGHYGDKCKDGDGATYKPSYEVAAALATPTTQYSSDDWRAWRNARPGECACGTNKEACWIHKDL